jgi:hypothetical protein
VQSPTKPFTTVVKTAFASLSLLLWAASANAELVEIQWQDGGKFERQMKVAPGKFAEVCGALKAGQTIAWSFDANVPLNFNIHYHLGQDVRYPTKQDKVQTLQGELAVDQAQDYCWMWVNKTAKASQLTMNLLAK